VVKYEMRELKGSLVSWIIECHCVRQVLCSNAN